MQLRVFLNFFAFLLFYYILIFLNSLISGTSPRKCAFRTAVLFPSVILGTGFLLNFFLIGKHSSGAIPFTTMIALLLLWFGVDLPLVFLGFHFGFRKQVCFCALWNRHHLFFRWNIFHFISSSRWRYITLTNKILVVVYSKRFSVKKISSFCL